jgi:NitT/TauT family transport system substrate-binding protein
VTTILAVSTFIFTACSGGADAPASQTGQPALEKTDINIGHLNSTAHLLAFVAAEEGFFKEEGLNATLSQFASSGELVSGLEGDKLDVSLIGSVPTLTFQSQGHGISVFGGAMTNGHGYVIKAKYVEGLKDWDINVLKGRNVASVKNSMQDVELLVLLKNAGIEIGKGPQKVNVVYFDSQKDAYAALQGAEIDAASVYSPYASLATEAGYKVVYYCNTQEEFKNQPCCRQVALTTALAQRPNTYQAIERALIKAYKFSQENHPKTIEDVAKYIDIDHKLIEYEVYGGHSTSHPDPDRIATASLKDEIVQLGYAKDYDIAPLYNTDVYAKALDSLAAEFPEDKTYQDLKTHFAEAN